ncbi:hypothetical protein [Alteraurantiacibacter aquimixticola]|uniref:Tetratricopeptide repeat protein n=1 Tax=Alteraurantiacibacter aquimixticola TaxID=2489173 RepID=A0A4T3F0X7_9SPHN|nr:hypothetical protein [Alteraurantiacibacter aquimixticola]TIX50709.1 hypothetical protein E5222_10695 [Alteraurantiacibacter aquimixticola]
MKARNYGFTHTAYEAVQQLRFMRGVLDVPEAVRAVIFRHGTQTDFADETFIEPDLYFVEVSSAKLIRVGEDAIQINYLYARYPDFFADHDRKVKYWDLASPSNAAGLDQWLEQQPSFVALAECDREILRNARVTVESAQNVVDSLSQFVDMVGRDRMIVTTHVNARSQLGSTLPRREQLIADVEAACEQLDLRCYNPTALMNQLGQHKALKDQGRDLTHFTDSFSDALFRDWNAHYFAVPAFAVADFGDGSIFDPARLDELLKKGARQQAVEYLRDAVEVYPANARLQRQLAKLEFEQGSLDKVAAIFGATGAGEQLAQSDPEAFLLATFAVGDHVRALEYGEGLLADELESPTIYAVMVQCAEALELEDKALGYWKKLFFFGGEQAGKAVSKVFALLDATGADRQVVREWAELVHERYPEQEGALLVLWQNAIADKASAKLVALRKHSRNLSGESMRVLAEACDEAGFEALAADLMSGGADETAASGKRHSWLAAHRDGWRRRGLAALEKGDKPHSLQCLRAAEIAGDRTVRSHLAKLEEAYLVDARAAYKERDLDRVLGLFDEADGSLVSFYQMDLLAGRTHYILGDFEKATDHLHVEVEKSEFDIRISRQLARAAFRAGRYGLAIDQFMLVSDRADGDEEIVADCNDKLQRLVARSIRHARDMIDRDRVAEAQELLVKVARIDGSAARLEKEYGRLASILRRKIKTLSASQVEERFDLGKRLFALDPDSALAAKAVADAAIRLGLYAEAIEYFEALRPLAGNTRQIDRQIEMCRSRLMQAAA